MGTVLLPRHCEGRAFIARSTQLYRGHAVNRLAQQDKSGYRRQHRRRLDAVLLFLSGPAVLSTNNLDERAVLMP